MRIFVMTDLEGISGVVDGAYLSEASDFFRSARQLLTAEANAAIAGCFDGGAREVVIVDGHYRHNNFEMMDLDPRAIVDKTPRPWTGALDGSFDATVMIGQHAMAGAGGFLDHTMCPDTWFSYAINGQDVGEIGMWATMAGHHKVPLVYLSGDEAACHEAEALLPGIVTTSVKKSVGRQRATGPNPAQAHEAIRADLARCLKNRKDWPKPLIWKKPMVTRLTVVRTDYADQRVGPGVKRLDARTLEKKASNQLDLLL